MKHIFLALLLLFAGAAEAATSTAKFAGAVPVKAGQNPASSMIYVTVNGTGAPATLALDNGAALANPFRADVYGAYQFNTTPGTYDIQMTRPDGTVTTWTKIGVGVYGAALVGSVTDTSLTSGRVVEVGTGGLLQDSAAFTYGSGYVQVGDATANSALRVNGVTGGVADVGLYLNSVVRWIIREDGASSDAFEIIARDNTGVQIDIPVSIANAAAGTVTIARPLSVLADTDADTKLGRARVGFASGGTADRAYFAHYDNFNSTDYALSHDSGGGTAVNAKTGTTIGLRINNTEYVNLSSSALTVSTVPVNINSAFAANAGLTTNSITNSGLTSGRIALVGTAGLMTDSAKVTASTGAQPTFTVGDGTDGPLIRVNGAAGQTREFRALTNGSLRWRWVFANATAEGGSNAGSDINLAAYDDTGTLIDTVWTVTRAAAGTFTINRPVTVSSTNAFKVAGLTSGRVTFATSGGQLTDAAGLTYTSPGTFTLGDGASAAASNSIINGVAGQERSFQMSTAGSRRWRILANATAEGGSNAGSNFGIAAYDDTGTLIDSPISIARVAAGTVTINRPVGITTGSFNVTNGASTLQITDAVTGSATTVLSLNHLSSGTPTASYGTQMVFNGHDDGNTNRNMGLIRARWNVATSASRTSILDMMAYNIGSQQVGISVLGGTIVQAQVAAELSLNNSATAYETGLVMPVMYSTTNTGAAYPFLGAGNLVISPRISGAARDIVMATGSTPSETMIVTGTNRVLIGTTTDDGSNKLQVAGNVTLNASSSTLTIGSNSATSPVFLINGAAGNQRFMSFQSGGVSRWNIMCDSTAESGSDAGSPLVIRARTDAGTAIDDPISIVRASTGAITFARSVTFADAKNIAVNGTTGTKIGTATSQKLGFWNATPIVQPSGTGETVGFTAGAGTNVTDASTFTGNVGSTAYRISDVVKALKQAGLLAQ